MFRWSTASRVDAADAVLVLRAALVQLERAGAAVAIANVSSGEIRELVPSERLVIFDEGKGEPMLGHATTITVTFEASGSGTTMKLIHGVFKSVEMRDECARGWTSTFNRLERLLRGEVE